MGIRHHGQGATILSKVFLSFILKHVHYLLHNMYLGVLDKKRFRVQVKNNHMSGSDSYVYSWLNGLDGSEQRHYTFIPFN
jgi:hypothetical protein